MNSFPADGDADILDDGPAAGSIVFGGESIENITVNGQGGNDDLSAKGGNGTGVPVRAILLRHGPGDPRHPNPRRPVAAYHARRRHR